MSYLESFLAQHARQERTETKATKGTKAPSVPFVASPPLRVEREFAPDPSLDHGLAVREVLTFPAALLRQLPLPTTLVLDMPGGGHVTVATHPGCGRADLSPTDWLAWCAVTPRGTVADVLGCRGATLRMVAIDGGQL